MTTAESCDFGTHYTGNNNNNNIKFLTYILLCVCVCVCAVFIMTTTDGGVGGGVLLGSQLRVNCVARACILDHAMWLYILYICVCVCVCLRKSPRGDETFPTRLFRKDNMEI